MKAKDAVDWLIDYAGPMQESLQTAWRLASGGAAGLTMRRLDEGMLKGIPADVGVSVSDSPATEAARKAILRSDQGLLRRPAVRSPRRPGPALRRLHRQLFLPGRKHRSRAPEDDDGVTPGAEFQARCGRVSIRAAIPPTLSSIIRRTRPNDRPGKSLPNSPVSGAIRLSLALNRHRLATLFVQFHCLVGDLGLGELRRLAVPICLYCHMHRD